jgi:hypothetical protein
MATNVTVYDLINYPDNGKTVTIDQKTIVPVSSEGDEVWVMSFVTTAYSDNTARTAIQDIYVQDIKTGWAKSSGFVNSPYVISATSRSLGIKIDASSQYYNVVLTEDTYDGEALAAEIESKIRALATTSGALAVADDSLAYLNAMVEFKHNKFYIISGNMSSYYTGVYRSSVKVTSSGVDTLYTDLGFNLGMDSETVAGVAVREAYLTQTVASGDQYLYVNTVTGMSVGDCIVVTDNITTDYTPILAISGSTLKLKVPITGTNGFDGITHTYSGTVTKVQVMRMQDPNQVPVAYHNTIDSIARWGIMSIANQVDYSS